MKTVIVIATSFALAFSIAQEEAPAGVARQAILVTGAGTAIGRAVTERLAADGYFVYVGARKDTGLEELNAIKNVRAMRLDVTKADEITAAVEAVTKAGRGLYGLVNNAGAAVAVKLALFEPEPKRRHMVVPNQYEAEITIIKLSQELVQLNEGHAYT